MKITKITVQRGKKIILDDKTEEAYEIEMDAQVEERDDPQEMIHALKSILDKHLSSWEFGLKNEITTETQSSKIEFKTANQFISTTKNPDLEGKEQIVPIQRQETDEEETTQLICPKCKEIMQKKDGKDYYMCSKHWGYPDMIRAGQVREKRF